MHGAFAPFSTFLVSQIHLAIENPPFHVGVYSWCEGEVHTYVLQTTFKNKSDGYFFNLIKSRKCSASFLKKKTTKKAIF